jgi:acyl-CoA reductase-like NAD-dependent aldehyde dehydrogenase
MATWKLFALAYKAQRGWSRIPPEQRRKMIAEAERRARKHGPLIARRIAQAAQQVRKAR